MIVLFTDFGAEGPYLGQMEAVLLASAPTIPLINLLSNAPAADPLLSSYLLAALQRHFPARAVFVCVVDPGVGGSRRPVVLEADGRWFVGPDNGLLNGVAQAAKKAVWRQINWRPRSLSASFHGRDLFAPIAARIAQGDFGWEHVECEGPDLDLWPTDLPAIIYCDHYGNAMTGWRYHPELDGRFILVNGCKLAQATRFSDVPAGESFWYENSLGLVEFAVNRGRADRVLGIELGTRFCFSE